MALQRRGSSHDFVKEQGKLTFQVLKERSSAKEWEANWGFYKHTDKILEEEAAKLGMSKDEYWSTVKEVESSKNIKFKYNSTSQSTIESLPKTSNGYIGWRNMHSLEKDYHLSNLKYKKPLYQTILLLG